MSQALERGIWMFSLVAIVPACVGLWVVGGYAMCGMEVYDTPPGSLGDQLCRDLVEPVWPWAGLAAGPLAISVVLGLLALRNENRRLLALATFLPFGLVALAVLSALALF